MLSWKLLASTEDAWEAAKGKLLHKYGKSMHQEVCFSIIRNFELAHPEMVLCLSHKDVYLNFFEYYLWADKWR